jgi:tRNA (guanine6-N2)-methyltransferase
VTAVSVRCVHGLEWLCAEEVERSLPDASDVRLDRREVTFRTGRLKRAADLRLADDVLVPVGQVPSGPDSRSAAGALAAALADLPWTAGLTELGTIRPVPARPVIDVVAAVSGRRYNRYAVENALGLLLADRTNGSYLRRTAEGRAPGDPDLTCRVFVQDDITSAALRLTRTPLHRRPWRVDVGVGALHPPVAAAMVRLADPVSPARVLDPFCGDGTILVEAALYRSGLDLRGSDIDVGRLDAARRNADRAGVRPRLTQRDAGRLTPEDADQIVTNPPWNIAVDAAGRLARGLGPFWDRLPAALAADGLFVGVTAVELDAPTALRERGFRLALGTQLRLAGRLCHLAVAAPASAPPPTLPGATAAWRTRAVAEGVVTETGF